MIRLLILASIIILATPAGLEPAERYTVEWPCVIMETSFCRYVMSESGEISKHEDRYGRQYDH